MQPADIAGKRLNRAMGAVSAAEKAAIEASQKPFKERSTPMVLSPQMFDSAVGLTDDDVDDGALMGAKAAFEGFSRILGEVYKREVTIREDRTQTPENQALMVHEMADRAIQPAANRADMERKNVVSEIGKIDNDINRALKSRMSEGEAREIREHVKSLESLDERRKFLAKADADTVAAVLSAKPFLSGLTETSFATVRHSAMQTLFPGEMARRAKLEKSQAQLETGWGRYLGEVSKLLNPNADAMKRWQEKSLEAVKAAFE